jgi:putative sterol carrier protein
VSVAEFLSDEWIASWVGVGGAPGPTGTVQVVVTGTDLPNDGKWYLRLDGGVVAEAAAGTVPAPDLTLTVGYAEGAAMAAGDLDPSVAFMRGRMKTAGDPGLVLDLLAGAASTRR